jgi:hypothetical protein
LIGRRQFGLGAGAALLSASATSARVRPRQWDTLKRFTVDLPPGFLMLPGRLAVDTADVQIMKGHKAYVYVAFGQFIEFPIEDQDPTLLVEQHPSNPIKTASVLTNGHRRVAQYLWETPSGEADTPSEKMIVFVYPLAPDQQPIADRIAASVRPRPLR